MIRSIGLYGGVLLSLLAGASATAQAASPAAASPTPSPVAASTAAGWSCQDGRCSYRKVQGGAWSDCFTSWSPTHGGWLPTRYCR